MALGSDFRDFALYSPLPELGASLLGSDRVSLFYDQAFIKEPGTRSPTDWHQDLPFWPALGNDIISLWVALTPVTVEGSGVEYVAGSHKWGKFYRAVTPDKDARFSNSKLEECPDFSKLKGDPQYRFLSWECNAGDVICHHPLTVHGASGNASTTRRAAISVRYAGPDAHWDPRPNVMRIEGEPEKTLHTGDPLILDGVFPITWEEGARRGMTSVRPKNITEQGGLEWTGAGFLPPPRRCPRPRCSAANSPRPTIT